MANRIQFQIGYSIDKAGLTEMQSLFQQIAIKAKEPGNELNTGLQKAATTANTLDGILEKTFNTKLGTLNVTKFNQELSKSGLTLKTVQSDLSQVGNQGATAYNRLAQAVLGTNLQLKESNKLLDSMADTFTKTVKWGIASSVFNNITNAIQKAYTYSKQLDSSLNDIRIVTDKSAENMDRFAEKANAAAKELGANTLDYTKASLIYYQQGLSDEEAQARAETTVKAANVTGQTGEEVSEQLTAVWNGYKVTAEETELYVDKLAAVAATTASDLEELSTGMSKVASAANSMGVDIDQLNAQLSTIISVTRQAPETAGTALKTIYARMGDLKVDGQDEFGVKLGDVSAQMETMGISILDETGDIRNMGEVIEEVAQKWNTWTEAQRQAAAVAMAGKRQYNNLIALFDNWDMYTDALKTSQDALGTLQHQQDIYMESTEAKLNTLKSTWQDLYKGLIDQDELNAGVDALTNLVQTFDNFIDSFGGGLKSITAFGAIVANIFNKQIANSINAALQRQEQYKQNIEALQLKQQTIQQGTIESTGSSNRDAAIAVNTQKQLDIAKQIYDVRVGLSTEEYNELTTMQQQVGQLAEQQKYLELQTVDQEKSVLNEERIKTLLTEEYDEASRLHDVVLETYNTKLKDLAEEETKIDALEQQVQKAIDLKNQTERWSGLKTQILKKAQAIGTAEATVVDDLLRGVKAGELTVGIKRQIIEACSKHYNLESENLDAIENQIGAEERVFERREQIAELKEKELNLENSINAATERGAQGAGVTQIVTMATSSLSSMAMAWSSVSSLIKTINDDTVSFGDKITQSFMTLGMAIPMVISSFTKLNEAFGYTTGVMKTFEALSIRNNALLQVTTSNTGKLTVANQVNAMSQDVLTLLRKKDNLTQEEEILIEKLSNASKKEQIMILGSLDAEKLVEIGLTKQEAKAIIEAKLAQDALNTSMLANPIMWAVAGMAALVAIYAAYNKSQEEALKNQIERSQKTIEEVNQVQEEVDANKELYDEYNKLYAQYKNGEVSKEQLYDVTDKLCDAYNLENAYLAKLTGNYDDLTAAINANRNAELERAKIETSRKKAAAQDELFSSAKLSKNKRDNIYYKDTSVASKLEDAGVAKWYNKDYAEDEYLFFNTDFSNAEEAIEYIEKLRDVLDEIEQGDYLEYSVNTNYQKAAALYADLSQGYQDYIDASNELDNYKAQQVFQQHDLRNISSLDEYQEKITAIKNSLSDLFVDDTEKIKTLLETYLQGIDNEFVQTGHGLEALKDKINLSEEDFQKLLNWSDEDKKLLVSGKVEFDGLQTEEDLRKALNIAKNSLSEEDLTIVTSLRSKVSSDKKLTKSQLKEAAGEQSSLAEDYDVELSDFDDQSQLQQVDTLNKIVEDKIALNKKYIENAKETAKEYAEIQTKRLATLKQEHDELYSKNQGAEAGRGIISEEEKARLEELEQILPGVEDQLENLKTIISDGLGIDEINELNYDNLISGIDSIITEADVLKNLTDDIGKNWTIAGDKIESFGKNFPEILENAENYKYLQDGSIQLTEQGRQALEDTLNIRKANLNATNEEYQLELQKQADIQQATADYYNQQADMLEAYLNGEADAKETEEKMEKGLADYKNQLMDITGANNEELNNLMQENGAITRDSAEKDEKKIYDYWCSVGEAAEAASLAYENQNFNPPPFNGGGGSSGGGKARSFKGKTTADATGLERLSSDQIESLISKYRKQAQDAANKAADYISKKVGAGAAVKGFENSADNAISGKGNGKSSGGGKDKKDKDEKKYEDEFDRYWEIKKAIDAVDRALKRLDKDQENLYGYELINSLKQENQLLEQQKKHYEELAAAQRAEAAELQGVLAGYGVAFDASGAITNYAAATMQALAQYNAAIAQYNAGLIDESALGVYEKNYEAFKKALQRYETLYYQEMQDTQDKLDDIWRQELANNLKAWEVEVKLKLDMKELKRGWQDFINEITDDFQKVYQDLRKDLKTLRDDARTYTGSEGTINTIVKAVRDVTKEIDKMRAGGSSSMFESISQAQEKLKELNQQLQDAGKSFHDLWVEAWKDYLEGIEQVSDQFDDLIEQFERINDELEFQKEIIQLLYGEEAYGLMDELYKGQEKNTMEQIKSLQQQKDMWEDLWRKSGATMDNQSSWTEDQKKYYDQWMKAQGDLNNLVLEYIQLLKDDYLNTVDKILKDLETAITGSSLKDLETEWERISAHADKYYDSVEGAYKVQSLANKIDQSIAAASNIKAQQKLEKLREREIDYLREKENLTEYDLQAAEARYQIALKEIALEEAQNNKTSMKLTRNEQGNWSYQYVADQDDVASKKQELLDAYGQLYQLASDAYEANLESLTELHEKYLESAKEIAENDTLNEEQKQQKLYELREWYLEEYKLLATDNALYRDDLQEASAMLLLEIYKQDEEAYTAMTETEKQLVDALKEQHISDFMEVQDCLQQNYKNIGDTARDVMAETRADWTSGAQTIADLWNSDEGFSVKMQVTAAYEAIIQANQNYQARVKECAAAVERDFGEDGISGAIRKAGEETDRLKGKTEDMVRSSVSYLNSLKYYVDQIAAAWQSVQQQILNTIALIEEYLKYVGEANRQAQQQAAAARGGGAQAGAASGGGSGGSGGGSTSGSKYYGGTDFQGAAGVYYVKDQKGKVVEASGDKAKLEKKYGVDFAKKFATGGYTGEWNSGDTDGRLAYLHQKELVLNKDDTANFLSGITMLRDMSSLNGSISNAIMSAVAGMVAKLANLSPGSVSSTSSSVANNDNKVFNINAEFPNAGNVDEIREAILSLPNLASQYIANNAK